MIKNQRSWEKTVKCCAPGDFIVQRRKRVRKDANNWHCAGGLEIARRAMMFRRRWSAHHGVERVARSHAEMTCTKPRRGAHEGNGFRPLAQHALCDADHPVEAARAALLLSRREETDLLTNRIWMSGGFGGFLSSVAPVRFAGSALQGCTIKISFQIIRHFITLERHCIIFIKI